MKIPKLGSLVTVGCISNQLPRFLADVIGQGRVHTDDEIDFDAVDFVAASIIIISRLIYSLKFICRTNGVHKRNYSFRMNIILEIFEIRSCIEIMANDTKIYQIYQYNSTMNTNIRTGGSSSFKRYEWVSYL